MTFKLGLTGSIGMGKSTTAKMFADLGCAVWDADAAVHRMYSKDGAAVAPMGGAFPDAIVDGEVSRGVLKEIISQDANALKTIESIVHPLVAQDRNDFLAETKAEIAVLDIPLLFENGAEAMFDAVACVSVSPDIQRQRVLARGTMSEAQFESILSKQMPIADKIAKSDYVIETDTLEHAQQQVRSVIEDIKQGLKNA
ncbi:dephospho-CoA kinase [Cognatishimia activa]|uniref:Dephospho-CoA kinase n=1 Tax=Cognatishimia activa TaxID=1715691 RepID=A0A0P1IM04_9RHOB|nr:dephospho-CoA kinase [Cognatishimia activa]CUI41227.1 Dephospho-CoA kinase [Cognatishimia activa]CUK24571.1 Dephospho-CoA kinase [Cognatishimia activa]